MPHWKFFPLENAGHIASSDEPAKTYSAILKFLGAEPVARQRLRRAERQVPERKYAEDAPFAAMFHQVGSGCGEMLVEFALAKITPRKLECLGGEIAVCDSNVGSDCPTAYYRRHCVIAAQVPVKPVAQLHEREKIPDGHEDGV